MTYSNRCTTIGFFIVCHGLNKFRDDEEKPLQATAAVND